MLLKDLASQRNIVLKFDKSTVDHNAKKSILAGRIIFVTSISKTSPYLCIGYFDAKSKYVNSVYVSEKTEVTECKGKVLERAFKSWAMRNLSATLYHSSFAPTVGSDPEIFVEDKQGSIIPAFDFLGSKKQPTFYKNIYQNNIYWDGFQAEFDTQSNTCLAYHVDSIQNGLKGLLLEARKHNKDAKLSIKTTFDIDRKLLEESKDEHVEFGCMPSLNAYGMEGIKLSGREVPIRSAGGHIHFGINNLKPEEAVTLVKALDAILGVACVSLFEKFDDSRRRTMYGLAGEYRLPKHGLEYRVLSNAWLCHPLITHIVFDVARKVLMFGANKFLEHWDATEKETIETINSCDAKKARKILKRNKELFTNILSAKYSKDAEHIYNIFMEGVHFIIDKPENLISNWDLDGEWIYHSDGKNKCWLMAKDAIASKKKVG